jgi:hypothetical protein
VSYSPSRRISSAPQWLTFAEQTDEIQDGGSVTLSAKLFGDSCPSFVLDARSYLA